MLRLGLLILFFYLAMPAAAATAAVTVNLYQQVAGGEEEYLVEKRLTIGRLAQQKGMRWYVLARQNKLKKPFRLKKGMILKIDDTHIVPAELSNGLVINLPELNLYYFKDGDYQRRYHLAVGKRTWPTPTGDYEIYEKRRNPTWNVPESIQEEMEEEGLEVVEQVPPGPQNPLGKFWMGTTASGVGIHATNRPWSVGYYVSHGCIRMLPEEIEKLFPQIPLGTPVKIIYQPLKMALTSMGRVFLEAHPNIYHWKMDSLPLIKDLVWKNRLDDRVDWDLVRKVLKTREGVARDVTKELPEPRTTTAGAPATPVQESPLFPLQRKEAKLE